MFSCCRPNPKNVKELKKDKHKKTTGGAGDQHEPKKSDKKLIIPTITIDSNGKDGDEMCGDGGEPTMNGNAAANGDNTVRAESAADAELATAETVLAARSSEAIVDNDRSDEQSKSSAPTSFTDDSTNTVINQFIDTSSDTHGTASQPTVDAEAAATATTNQMPAANNAEAEDVEADADAGTIYDDQEQRTGSNDEAENLNGHAGGEHHQSYQHSSELPPKSCLSRHNSTRTSTKKKVNISAHAEIIEPDPLPPPPYDHLSLGDDDDVFSDSLPPPKRESMCAPYMERDEAAETAPFVHGLPEWFNDERINDIGCTEPPVTPVGRDELELKRQRLYTDLLRAAHAAVEHNVRFTPLAGGGAEAQAALLPYNLDSRTAGGGGGGGGGGGDCDPDLKPSVAENLEHLVNRLERLVDRLERSVSARELEIANRTFDTVLEKKRESFDFETTELPPLPVASLERELLGQQTDSLNQRILRIETSLNKINDSHSNSLSASQSQSVPNNNNNNDNQQKDSGSLENIPTTVLEDYPSHTDVESDESQLLLPPPPPPPPLELPLELSLELPTASMSVLGYQDIVNGPLSQYLAFSAKIGGDVAKHAELVKLAFDAQLQYVTLATQCSKPNPDKQMELLKPTSMQISAIQDFREKNRASTFFNHLSAISESIPALGWVCVSPTPGPHVKEMNDAGQFYTNRVLKEWKEKNTTHVEWARAWVQTLTELQAFIKQYHTTGLVWSGKGSAPAGAAPPPPPIGACPPPPPPPAFDLAAMSLEDGGPDERSALFAQINQGEAITKNLKKVTADMQTHKNPTLRTGPAPFKATQFGTVNKAPAPPVVKEPVFTRDGKKWLIEHQKNNTGLLVDNAEMNNVIYVFKCEGSTLTVKGKVNNIVFDSCKKCSLLFDSVVASVEFVNCQSVQMQVLGFVPTISIDKTDGCQMFLTNESLGVEIVSSKSSEMNVILPDTSGDYTELALPEQFKTTISGKTLKTVCVDSLG